MAVSTEMLERVSGEVRDRREAREILSLIAFCLNHINRRCPVKVVRCVFEAVINVTSARRVILEDAIVELLSLLKTESVC